MSYSFESLAELILRGEASVETVPDVPAWPSEAELPDKFLVLMHRECIGSVALFGVLSGQVVMAVAYSSALRRFCESERVGFFSASESSGEESARRLMQSVIAEFRSEAESPDIFMIGGVEAAELLRELSRYWRVKYAGGLH